MDVRRVTRKHRAIRFQVDKVPLAPDRLDEKRTHEAFSAAVGTRVEACNDYTSRVVAAHTHPLVEACFRAWLDHRPLVITPDAIWLTLAQGFAAHVNANADELRSKLVFHEGKKQLEVDGHALGFVPGSPENPWPLAFREFGAKIRAASSGAQPRSTSSIRACRS